MNVFSVYLADKMGVREKEKKRENEENQLHTLFELNARNMLSSTYHSLIEIAFCGQQHSAIICVFPFISSLIRGENTMHNSVW